MKGLFFPWKKKTNQESNQQELEQTAARPFNEIVIANKFQESLNLEVAIQHYMPARLPLHQSIQQQDVVYFKELWDVIYMAPDSSNRSMKGPSLLSQLFDVFYGRLFSRSEQFRVFFGTDFKERCRTLTRQLVFFTNLKLNSEIDDVFRRLGVLHRKLGISNWQYSVFVEVLLESLAAVLKEHADMLRMQSCARVVSFCLYKLMEHTLTPAHVKPLEMNINYKIDENAKRTTSSMELSALQASKMLRKKRRKKKRGKKPFGASMRSETSTSSFSDGTDMSFMETDETFDASEGSTGRGAFDTSIRSGRSS